MTAYYNENDKGAAAWLRELINAGHIMAGEVDERSIHDVEPQDLEGFTRCHFFAGIGGWDYALQLAGWPADRPVWTGSCPCQPFSNAGKGLGTKDPRHLWPEFRRLIAECRPSAIFGEQVASKAGREWIGGVFADLEAVEYAVAGADLCSAGVGAPHIRQRLYWLADAAGGKSSEVRRGREEDLQRGRQLGLQQGRDSDCPVNSGLGQPDMHRCEPGRTATKANGYGGSDEPASGVPSGFGNANGGRREQARRDEQGGPREEIPRRAAGRRRGAGSRGLFDLVRCVEPTKEPGRYVEKWRRVEPGTLPLAHGIPGRVGLLRGYGNAIDPEVAEQFIRSYMEASHAK